MPNKNHTHFLHYCVHSSGYQNFLEQQKFGKEYQFNYLFFFSFPVWLIMNKMYTHFFIIMFFYSSLIDFFANFLGVDFKNSTTLITWLFCFFHLLFTFTSQKIYQIHLDNKFYKMNYDVEKCMKEIKSYPIYINILLLFALTALTVVSFNLVRNLLVF